MELYRIVLLLAFVSAAQSAAPASLRLVNLVYRHGDRSPVSIFPTDPNQVSVWPQGLGWLSTVGMQEQYALGRWLRNRYQGYLNDTYIHTEIQITSSDENRCLMSAYSNLAGLYPPMGEQVWNPDLKWQPIPVHTRPENEDNVLNMGKDCPRYDDLYSKSLKSDAVRKEEKDNKDFYEFVSKESGVPKENITKIWAIADTLICEKAHNLTWASWVNESIYERLLYLNAWSFDLMFHGLEESKLKGGPLLKLFVDSMKARQNATRHPKASATPMPKVYMYSAHDTTVAALMSALQCFNKMSPPYASMVLAELHEENDSWHVEFSYKNTTGDPYPLLIPGCPDFKCPFDTFLEATKDAIPIDWDAECQIGSHTTDVTFNLATLIALSTACGVLILIMVAVLINCFVSRRRRNDSFYNRFAI